MIGQTLMTFDALVDALQLGAVPETWSSEWEAARERYALEGADFLSDASLEAIDRLCGFPEDIRRPLAEAVSLVRTNRALFELAWLWYSVLFSADDHPEYGFADWPLPVSVMGEAASLFPAVVILSRFPRMLAYHRAHGISEDITRATCSDLAVWMRHYRRLNGKWGFMQLPWLMRHCRGGLYRLGRLQFESIPYNAGIRAFKQRTTGKVLALSEAGITYRRDGLVDGTNHVSDEQAWVAGLEIGDRVIRGHPVSPSGWVRHEQVELPADQWEQQLAPGDQILNIHIPEDGRMDYDLCGDALSQADRFFPRHFPELPPHAAFVCGSWLLDSQLQLLLPPSSNIVRFQQEFYLSPMLSYQEETFMRIFGSMPDDLTTAPRNTALERAVLDFTLAGHALRCAWGFILRGDLNWGSQRYQRRIADYLTDFRQA